MAMDVEALKAESKDEELKLLACFDEEAIKAERVDKEATKSESGHEDLDLQDELHKLKNDGIWEAYLHMSIQFVSQG